MESISIYCREDEKYPIKPYDFGAANDYKFMRQNYLKSDFRYDFVQYFQRLLAERMKWETLYSCKIVYNPMACIANLLTVHIYLAEPSVTGIISQQLEKDKGHPVFDCFDTALEQFPLPAAKEHLIRVVLEDTCNICLSYFVNLRYAALKKAVMDSFPVVEGADYYGCYFYLILSKACDLEQLKKEGTLEAMKRACYAALVKSTSEQKELPYARFHIKVDNSGIYQEKGSRCFFDEYMDTFLI